MVPWRSLVGVIKSFNSTVAEDGGATDYHELVDDREYSVCQVAESANGYRNESEAQELRQPASKGLELLHSWPKNTTPLCMVWSTAANVGRICDLTVIDIKPTTRDTRLHLAVWHGQDDNSRWLVETLNRAALNFANSRKQLNTLMEESPSLSDNVEVNTKTNGEYTALDIRDALPEDKENDLEMEKILRRAGASRARDINEKKPDSSNHEVHIKLGIQRDRQPSPQRVTRSEFPTINYHGLLLTATMLATTTFHAALRAASGISDISFTEPGNSFLIGKQDGEINNLFILFNSVVFFTSLALITILTHELPIKPWLQIVLFSTIGAYMCLIVTVSPHEVLSVFFIGSFILLATFLKCLAFDSILLDCLQQIWTRIQVVC